MSMREKYQSLALVDLKEIAKSRGIKGTSSMKKADVIERMVILDEKESQEKGGTAADMADAPVVDAPTEEKRQTAEDRTGVTSGKRVPQKSNRTAETGNRQPAAEQENRRPVSKRQEGSGRTAEHPSVQERGNGGRNQNGGTGAYRNGEKRVVRRYPQGQSENGQRRHPETRVPAEATEAAAQARSSAEPKPVSQARPSVEARPASQNRLPAEGKAASEARIPTETKTAGQAADPMEGRSAAPGIRQDNGNAMPVSGANEEERFPSELDSGISANGILEVLPDGYGFIRSANYLPGDNDVYVAPSQIRRFGLKTGDIVVGNTRVKTQNEKFSALLYVKSINGQSPDEATKRHNFEDMTPIFPNERIRLELSRSSVSMRIMDLMSPVGKGQRGMIVSPPKAGKTTLLKQVAQSVKTNHPDMHLIILLIDERPEEVTDFREAIEGPNVEVIYSTFDELPDHHKRVAEMVIERAKRLVEHKKDVMILLDSITRLTRAYNLVIPPSGRTLSGGLDPAALHMPKRFFGAARKMREGGSLTILATALVDTGSRMDDVIYEEFKGTGNMEIVLDRKLSERRIFPAIDIPRSSTRREDLLLAPEELEATGVLRKALNGLKPEEAVDKILDMFTRTRNNAEFVNVVKKMHFV